MATKIDTLTELRPAELAAFSESIRQLIKVTGKDMKTIVRQTAQDWVRKAISATRLGPKYTTHVFVKRGVDFGAPDKPFLEENETVGRLRLPSRMIGSGTQGKVLTPGRGYAKSGWIRGAVKLGIKSSSKFGGWGGRKPGDYRDQLSSGQPTFTISNFNPYISTMDSGGKMPDNPRKKFGTNFTDPGRIVAKATRRAQVKMTQKLDRLAKKAEGIWRS